MFGLRPQGTVACQTWNNRSNSPRSSPSTATNR
jgi:hypothetical protein